MGRYSFSGGHVYCLLIGTSLGNFQNPDVRPRTSHKNEQSPDYFTIIIIIRYNSRRSGELAGKLSVTQAAKHYL